MKLYVESNDNYYVAGWEEIAHLEGIGKTPLTAISNLEKGLREALSNNGLLERIGRSVVEMVLDEMEEWEEYRKIAEHE